MRNKVLSKKKNDSEKCLKLNQRYFTTLKPNDTFDSIDFN